MVRKSCLSPFLYHLAPWGRGLGEGGSDQGWWEMFPPGEGCEDCEVTVDEKSH